MAGPHENLAARRPASLDYLEVETPPELRASAGLLFTGDGARLSSEAYVYTPRAIPKTELSTTERANRRFKHGGPIMTPPIVAMPPIIMRPTLSCRRHPSVPARRTRSGRTLRAPCTDSHGQQQCCDKYNTHFYDPYQTASGDKRAPTLRMRCGCSGYEPGRPTFPQALALRSLRL